MARRRSVRRRPYRVAQLEARQLAGRLSVRALRDIQAALVEYSDRLAALVGKLSRGRAIARTTQHLMDRAALRLQETLEAAIRGHRLASYEEVYAAWQDATLARLKAAGLTDRALISLVRDPPITLLGAYDRLGSAASTWKTLIDGYVRHAAREADHIVRAALLEGVSPPELARRLRPYVRGAEPFHRAFGGLEGVDLRKLEDPALRHAAGNLLHNSNRIAFTEVHNARAEAELTEFAADPFVEAVAWRLAPDRGTQVEPDECDVFAAEDFYGLGEGVYPVTEVPVPPHPWDRCERVPVVRSTARAGDPKPAPGRRVSGADATIPGGRGLTADERDRIRARVETNLRAAARASGDVESLATTATGRVP